MRVQAMSHLNTIYNQLLHLIPRHKFDSLVLKHSGDYYTKSFDSWQHFITLLYAQIKSKDSLRDIVTGLITHQSDWYHIGLENIHRSTLSDANNRRNYQIFEGIFGELLSRCKDITPKHKFRFDNPLYSLDASVIDLCLNMFPWAVFRKKKGGIKLHCLLEHKADCLPDFLVITDAKQHDVRVAKDMDLPILSDSIISVDRAYIHFKWLYSLKLRRIWFVTRAKENIQYKVVGQQKPNKKKGVIFDKTIKLTGFYAKQDYPEELRMIKYRDKETDKTLVFLTDNFYLAASTIAQIYKSRWQIELFFKWIKQNLKIKSFLGTSKNAVLSQIWVAMCYYLIVAYIKYQTKYSYSLLELTRLLSEAIFLRVSILDLLSLNSNTLHRIRSPDEQLRLF